jgi:hypothetical protein
LRTDTESQFACAILTFSCDARNISSESKAVCCAMSLEDPIFALPAASDDFVKFLIEDGSAEAEVAPAVSSPNSSKSFG